MIYNAPEIDERNIPMQINSEMLNIFELENSFRKKKKSISFCVLNVKKLRLNFLTQ